MSTDPTAWRKCSTCKHAIPYAADYFTCNVSTCNRGGTAFVFCSVACWDGHVPVLRHRDAWAVEATAPSAEQWAQQQRETGRPEAGRTTTGRGPAAAGSGFRATATEPDTRESAPRRRIVTSVAAAPAGVASSSGAARLPHDVLVVVSKLKLYVRERSGMNTSEDVIEVLSDRLRTLCDDAIDNARAAGRKTVMARDFRAG